VDAARLGAFARGVATEGGLSQYCTTIMNGDVVGAPSKLGKGGR